MTSATNSANWNTSNTNFSIFIPFGFSGFTRFPSSSTYGTFFTATCGFNKGSNSLGRGAGGRKDADETGHARGQVRQVQEAPAGHESTDTCPPPLATSLPRRDGNEGRGGGRGPRPLQEQQQQANLDTQLYASSRALWCPCLSTHMNLSPPNPPARA